MSWQRKQDLPAHAIKTLSRLALPSIKNEEHVGDSFRERIMRSLLYAGWHISYDYDPFGGARPRLLRRGKEALLRVNPERAQAFSQGSRRVDIPEE